MNLNYRLMKTPLRTPAKTPKTPKKTQEVDGENEEEREEEEEEEDVAYSSDEEDEEGENYDEEQFLQAGDPASMLVDDGPFQTPFPTPMKTPKKTPMQTPRKIPKTPRTAKSAKTPKRKKSKSRRRKSVLDMAALTNEQEALAALESNQILHLKLRRKYYAEALNFIRQLEAAMETVGQLLGSMNKAEVLEAMEFFRVAYEYQFDSAHVSDLHRLL